MKRKNDRKCSSYNSKVDLWLIILLSLSICGASAWLISLEGTYSAKGIAFGLVLLLFNITLPLWFIIRCHYVIDIDTGTLIIRFGPVTWNIPFNSISQVTNTSELSFSPSLSLERLKIVYGKGRVILISPKQQERFVRELTLQLNTEHLASKEKQQTP